MIPPSRRKMDDMDRTFAGGLRAHDEPSWGSKRALSGSRPTLRTAIANLRRRETPKRLRVHFYTNLGGILISTFSNPIDPALQSLNVSLKLGRVWARGVLGRCLVVAREPPRSFGHGCFKRIAILGGDI
jgi:hypothetical protein